MKLDFEQLKSMSDSFHKQYIADGDTSEQLDKGSMVYSINFDPVVGACSVHVQWPYFRNLVANESDHLATYSVVQQNSREEPWIHWTCSVLGVKITACMDKNMVLDELKTLEFPAGCVICEEDDIESLLTIWQNMTGWNLDWEAKSNG